MGADPSVAGQAGTITELVQFEGANGAALGPFVRKRIDLSLGVGMAYQGLYEAQCSGARFAHVPESLNAIKRVESSSWCPSSYRARLSTPS